MCSRARFTEGAKGQKQQLATYGPATAKHVYERQLADDAKIYSLAAIENTQCHV